MNRASSTLRPDWRTGRLATALLGIVVAGLVGAFAWSGWGAPVQPLAILRLLFTLPPLVMFGSVLAVRAFTPPLLAPMLGVAMAGLTLWSAFGAGLELYTPAAPDDLLEVFLMSVTVVGLVGYLWASQQEGRRVAARAHEAATRDPLTGLLNRAGLECFYGGLEPGIPLTLAMLDLNGLKKINDWGGHGEGDAHLKRVADGLAGLLGERSAAVRWGGDEFVLALPYIAPETAARKLAGLDRALRVAGGGPVFAVGVVALRAGEPLRRALALADARMYEAKARQGGGLGELGEGRRATGLEAFAAEIERLETPAALVEAAFTLARRDLGFDAALYFREKPEGFLLTAQAGTLPLPPAARAALQRPRARAGLGGLALESGLPVWTEDYPAHPLALPTWTKAGLKSCLVVPVFDEGRPVGLLNLYTFGDWQAVTPAARRAVQAVALRLGHVLERDRLLSELRRSLEGGFLGLGIALEARDLETAGHTERVVQLAEQLGDVLELPAATRQALRQGAYLHDIGKLAVPDQILLKPGSLDADEWAVMKSHSVRGFDIARSMAGLGDAPLQIIRYHHERWDGHGYPDGLRGGEIPLAARIFSLCDVYDALTSARPYKQAWSREEALAEIAAQRGRQFDPELVTAFLELMGAPSPAEPAEAVLAEV